MESIRALLHRHADELADALAAQSAPAKNEPRKRRARGPVIVVPPPMEMTPEEKDYAARYVRRAFAK